MTKSFLFFFLVLITNLSFSQENETLKGLVDKDKLPVPKEDNQLFYLQRDPDLNTIVYTLNLKDGKLNTSEPVHAYWIRYAEDGSSKKLNFIQRKMAYGISHTEIEPGVYEIHVQAYKPLKIILSKNKKTKKYQTFVKVKDTNIILDRIFVRIDGGSLFKPNVKYIEICGRDSSTGKEVNYQYIP